MRMLLLSHFVIEGCRGYWEGVTCLCAKTRLALTKYRRRRKRQQSQLLWRPAVGQNERELNDHVGKLEFLNLS
jgi:hypothetical protein